MLRTMPGTGQAVLKLAIIIVCLIIVSSILMIKHVEYMDSHKPSDKQVQIK